MIYTDIKNGRFYNEDCFDAMREIPDGVIDMILCDLPYGTTACKWDTIIPFDKLWAEYFRVAKSTAAIVLTASQPFSSTLLTSNINNYRYSWIWEKSKSSNFLLSKKQPLKNFEEVLIFSKETCLYNPQMTEGEAYKARPGSKVTEVYNPTKDNLHRNGSDGKRYPKAIQYFKTAESEGPQLHPTQKPVALFEYLIKTYTNEGELVLDNTAGSGTTAIAAINTNRKWVCIEKEKEYYDKAIERIVNHNVN